MRLIEVVGLGEDDGAGEQDRYLLVLWGVLLAAIGGRRRSQVEDIVELPLGRARTPIDDFGQVESGQRPRQLLLRRATGRPPKAAGKPSELVAELLGGREAVVRALLHRLVHDLPQLVRNPALRIAYLEGYWRPENMADQQAPHVCSLDGKDVGEELVKDDAERVEVAPSIDV